MTFEGSGYWLDDAVEGSQHRVMEIRQATAEDVSVLAELAAEVQALHHAARPDWFKPPDAEAAEPLYAQLLEDREVVAYIAEEGPARPLGYVIVRVVTRPDTALTWAAKVVDVDQIGNSTNLHRPSFGRRACRWRCSG